MNFDNFDEYGNIIENSDNEENLDENLNYEYQSNDFINNSVSGDSKENSSEDSIILFEDKKYFPDMKKIYPEAEVIYEDEDNQDIEEAIIKCNENQNFLKFKKLESRYKSQFLIDLAKNPEDIYNICFVGSIHHGKTSFLDEISKLSFKNFDTIDKNLRVWDNRKDETDKLISIKTSVLSCVLQDSKSKSYLFNLIDTPGHLDFWEEVEIGLRLCDGVFLIVDVIEGVMNSTEKLILKIIKEKLDCVLVINKLDRLINELKLPPEDSYLKIKSIIDEVNYLFKSKNIYNDKMYNFNPKNDNVLFNSSKYSLCFNLSNISNKYKQNLNKFLWGDYYYDHENEEFINKKINKRSFVEFILEPIYKIMSNISSKGEKEVKEFLNTHDINLKYNYYKTDTNNLITMVYNKFFNGYYSFIDSTVKNICNSKIGNINYLNKHYVGEKENSLIINIVKNTDNEKIDDFYSIGRIVKGNIKEFQKIKLIGEEFQNNIEEEKAIIKIKKIFFTQTIDKLNISNGYEGNILLFEGISDYFKKSSTIIDNKDEVSYFKNVHNFLNRNIKIALEPFIPSEIHKMLNGLKKLSKSYACLETKVEQTGEYYIVGCGEMYLDCALDDLRNLYTNIEIRTSEPFCNFKETILEHSNEIINFKTKNKSKISLTSEPIEKELWKKLDEGIIQSDLSLQNNFLKKLKWDNLEIKSIWSFGPKEYEDNILIDYSIPYKNNPIYNVKEHLIKGFNWSIKNGPLIEESIRGVKHKLLNCELNNNEVNNQLIPAMKKACYSSMMISSPRILEPINFSEIICTYNSLETVYGILKKRRGNVIKEYKKVGTPLSIVQAKIPILDSFGFETDLRIQTIGQAFCTQYFLEWDIVPGDPLDKSKEVKNLEPSIPSELSREILVKIRRRKGLNENINIFNYLDEEQIVKYLKNNNINN